MKQILLLLALLLPICAFAQLEEGFDGPAINSKNPWVGDVDKFTIVQGMLLFTSPTEVAGEASVYVPITYSNNMTWEVDAKLDFKVSNSKNLRIYVYATNLSADNTLYYIQVGNNSGQISLYSQKGMKSAEPIIKGRSILKNETQPMAHIHLTLKDNKTWTLYTRLEGEAAYTEEGTYTFPLKDLRTEGKLNLTCRYIKTSISTFAFDNIKVSPFIKDLPVVDKPETPIDPPIPPVDPPIPPVVVLPELLSIDPLSASELQFIFDKEVNINKATFAISTIGQADRMVYGETKAIVNTHYPEPMKNGADYTISYQGVTDPEGHTMADYSMDVTFQAEGETPDPSQPGSVVINEVMADINGLTGLPATEYVELHNTAQTSLSLSGWSFLYGDNSTLIGEVTLPADGYAVLYRAGREINAASGLSVPLATFPAQLANTGKQLTLKDAVGTIIDQYAYPKAKPAKSWERGANNTWHLSTDTKGGTPGTANSSEETPPDKPTEPDKPVDPDIPTEPDKPTEPNVPEEPGTPPVEPQEILFNELLPNPATDGSEYIELYNNSDKSCSLKGLTVATRKTDGSLSTLYPLASINSPIKAKGYAVLTKSSKGVSDFFTATYPEVIYELKIPVLANTSSTLVLLRTADQQVIDEVSYSSKWHTTAVKEGKGVALERINPLVATQNSGNWASASATSGYGTPGYLNSQHSTGETTGIIGIEPPVLDESTNLYTLLYYLQEPGYSCRIYIYNTTGQRMAQIANHTLMGTEGSFTWDGNGLDGKRLNSGIYIFYAELYHPNGKVINCKKVFLMH